MYFTDFHKYKTVYPIIQVDIECGYEDLDQG